jgi:hypothetical protein
LRWQQADLLRPKSLIPWNGFLSLKVSKTRLRTRPKDREPEGQWQKHFAPIVLPESSAVIRVPEFKSRIFVSFGWSKVYSGTTNAILQNLYKLQTIDIAGLASTDPQAEGLRAAIPSGMLANYDRARARGKKGIALVRNHVCTNCRIQVPVAVTVSLAAGMIQACGNCGLYLCLPDEQPVLPLAAVSVQPGGRKRANPIAKTSGPTSR